MRPDVVLARRRAEQDALIEQAHRFARALPSDLGVVGVAVFGSVARGDFNVWSDIDVLVIAEHLPERFLDRFECLGRPPTRVQPVAWTPGEWGDQLRRKNPIAVEAADRGIWLTRRSDGALDQDDPVE